MMITCCNDNILNLLCCTIKINFACFIFKSVATRKSKILCGLHSFSIGQCWSKSSKTSEGWGEMVSIKSEKPMGPGT